MCVIGGGKRYPFFQYGNVLLSVMLKAELSYVFSITLESESKRIGAWFSNDI